MNSRIFGLTTLVASAPFLAHVAHAQTPLARLTGVLQKVEVRSGRAAFRALKMGAAIGRGDVVRTGRRSKADIKFGDGSLVRLGQLSSLEVRGPRQVEVKGGKALISWLSPGKIGTSYAAAEIKGTIVHVDVDDEGATFTLYEGATEVVTARGRQELKPGTQVTARPDGTLSGLRAAAPIFFAQAGAQLDLKDAPKSGAFAGSGADVAAKNEAVRQGLRDLATDGTRGQITAPQNIRPTPTPATTPQPTATPAAHCHARANARANRCAYSHACADGCSHSEADQKADQEIERRHRNAAFERGTTPKSARRFGGLVAVQRPGGFAAFPFGQTRSGPSGLGANPLYAPAQSLQRRNRCGRDRAGGEQRL